MGMTDRKAIMIKAARVLASARTRPQRKTAITFLNLALKAVLAPDKKKIDQGEVALVFFVVAVGCLVAYLVILFDGMMFS